MFRYRRQRPVKGGRQPLPSCVLSEIHRAVEADAMRYGVSKSFVISVILARAYKIDSQEPLQQHADVPHEGRLPPIVDRLKISGTKH
jgi:hypothetical protein